MKNIHIYGLVATAGIPLLVMAACGEGGGSGSTTGEALTAEQMGDGGTGDGAAPSILTAATFDTTEVGNITIVLNNDEVTQGQVATSQASMAEVKAFADMMVTDHGAALKRLEAIQGFDGDGGTGTLTTQTAVADPTGGAIAHDDGLITNDLKTQSGPAFDLAYMTAQITGHARMLSMIDRSLQPSLLQEAKNGDAADAASSLADANKSLREELTQERVTVVNHLVEALKVQKQVRDAMNAQDGGAGDGGAADGGGQDAGQDGAATDGGPTTDAGGDGGQGQDGGPTMDAGGDGGTADSGG